MYFKLKAFCIIHVRHESVAPDVTGMSGLSAVKNYNCKCTELGLVAAAFLSGSRLVGGKPRLHDKCIRAWIFFIYFFMFVAFSLPNLTPNWFFFSVFFPWISVRCCPIVLPQTKELITNVLHVIIIFGLSLPRSFYAFMMWAHWNQISTIMHNCRPWSDHISIKAFIWPMHFALSWVYPSIISKCIT